MRKLVIVDYLLLWTEYVVIVIECAVYWLFTILCHAESLVT